MRCPPGEAAIVLTCVGPRVGTIIGPERLVLFRSGPVAPALPEGRDYAALAALGVKTVIDLQADGTAAERKAVEAAGMTHRRGLPG
jgi:hypothetical protein